MTAQTVDEWLNELSQYERIQSEAQIRQTWDAAQSALRDAVPDAGGALTAEEVELLQYLIDDPDWDVSQRGEVWELLPKLLSAAQRAAPLQGAARAVVDVAIELCKTNMMGINVLRDAVDAYRAALPRQERGEGEANADA